MTRKVTSYRLPKMTLNQIESLAKITGSSDANVISTAIDRMYQQEMKTMTKGNTNQSSPTNGSANADKATPPVDGTDLGDQLTRDNLDHWRNDTNQQIDDNARKAMGHTPL